MTEKPKRALLVIDVQNEYFTGSCPSPIPLAVWQTCCLPWMRRANTGFRSS